MLLNKAYYTFKFLVPRRLQIQLRRYYVNRKRLQHADIWLIDPNAAQLLEYVGKTGASEKEGQRPIFKGKIGSRPSFRGSCTGFSGPQDGKEKSGAVPPFPDGMGAIFPFWVPSQDPQKEMAKGKVNA